MKTFLRALLIAAWSSALTPFALHAQDTGSGRPPIVFKNDPTPPIGVEGWKVETVLLAPKIESPSVVCTLPDGRVLIGQDPLDNNGGKEPVDSILCLWPDGHTSIWADHLYPVFGLAYIDGKVYVHQFPILSVYDDDSEKGVGLNRKDLISHTGKPTIGGLNDHIPSQIRLAMDGYLYMTSGDRGIWQAKSNVDDREIELAGGGIARIRPDGTGLEVYCTGTRNHLDVSMTSEDEKFTYDNTDDGHGWWTRFTHMVDGGYYGYPWDYKAPEEKNDPASHEVKGKPDQPYKPYTLWRAAEYGGGSPTGAIGYTEDALPPEYRDNLFHCEWGKGMVQRFVVSREGGTFKVDKMQDFLKPGGDLRPLGIAVSEDGLSFWVTDWGYGGWLQKKPQIGRLIKVTWTGKNYATPKPKWYVAAAMGKKFEATTAELIEGLKHPARSVRMVAQRRLAERGAEAVAPLEAMLRDGESLPAAKWHAMWALAVMPTKSKDVFAAKGIAKVLASSATETTSVRRQAIRFLGESSDSKADGAADILVPLLGDADSSVRFYAATALGRIADSRAIRPILQKLEEKDLFTRFALFTALNRIGRGDPKSWPIILEGLEFTTEAIRVNSTYALRNTYDSQLVSALTTLAYDKTRTPGARGAALLAAADLCRQPKPWAGNWWGTQPVGSPRPPKVVDWEGTTTILSAIQDLAKDPDATVRAAAIKAMAIAPDAGFVDPLVDLYGKSKDPALQTTILEALALTKSPKASALATTILKDKTSPPSLIPAALAVIREGGGKDAIPSLIDLVASSDALTVLEPAIDTLGQLKAAAAVPAIAARIASKETAVWTVCITSLQAINDKAAVDALVGSLGDSRYDVRKAAATALGMMKARDAVPALVESIQKKQLGGDAVSALSKMPDIRGLDIFLGALAGKDAGAARAAKEALTRIKAEAQPLIEQKLAAGEIKPQALVVLQEIYLTIAPVMQWQVIGPFDGEKPDLIDGAKLTSGDGTIKVPAGATLTWKPTRGDSQGMVDLNNVVGGGSGTTAAFLFAEIESKTDRQTTMQFGSDDTHVIWLNGEKIAEDTDHSGWKPDEVTVKAKLKAGKNILVVRCGNYSGPWQFSAAVAGDRSGKLFETKPTLPGDRPTRDGIGAFAAAHKGDAAKGKAVFTNLQGASCIKCHQLSPTEGGIVGPSLAGVGAKYNKAQLIESVLYPSKQILDGYQQSEIRTKDGDVIAGIVKSESDSEITVYDAAAQKIVVKKADIKSRKVSQLSVMPEGLEQAMNEQDFADLVTFLEGLKEAVKP